MVNKLDDEVIKLQNKNHLLCKRLDDAEVENDRIGKEHEECEKVIKYYKDREV